MWGGSRPTGCQTKTTGISHIEPKIIPRSEHSISRAYIDSNAVKVLYRLKDANYAAYLVGGGVRDLLLGREPKDFDVATDARPEEIRAEFKNCRLVGRRFRLAHVMFGREVVEVATFRAAPTPDDGGLDDEERGPLLRDNVYGTLEEDAWRRDFTVNALYYDIRDFSVVDYTGGLADLNAGVLRLIGDDPALRYREDPVRMLRAVRFAVKLGFRIDAKTEAPIAELGHLLADIPAARLYEEVLKLFMAGYALQTFERLRHYNLFRYLFPATDALLAVEENHFPHLFLSHALRNTDSRIAEDKPVAPAFIFAALLWDPVRHEVNERMAQGVSEIDAWQQASDTVVQRQVAAVSLPKRFTIPMREIWLLQARLQNIGGRRPVRLMEHPRFRAAYDFLLLRAQAGEAVGELAQWWTRFQAMNESERSQLLSAPASKGPRRVRSKRRRVTPKHADAP